MLASDNDKMRAVIQKQQEIIQMLMDIDGPDNSSIEPDTSEPDIKEPKIKTSSDIEGFKKWLSSKSLSKNSIDTYTTAVKLFFKEYGELSTTKLSEYEKSFSRFSPQTANIKIIAMEKYFNYVGYKGYSFKKIKVQKQSFCDNAISEKEYLQLMDYAKSNSPRTWLICKVIASTGVRVSELVLLKTEALSQGYMDIVGKGSKQRRIYFPKSLVNEIKDCCGKTYIIENKYGNPITTRGVDELIRSTGIKAGIPKKVLHPHSFRHFFAKQFVKNKNDISLLGDLLGHSSISTTAIYTRLTSEEQREEIDKIIDW